MPKWRREPAVTARRAADGALLPGSLGRAGLPGRSVLDELQVGVVVLDEDDRLVLVNPAARAMGLVRSGGAGEELSDITMRALVGQVRRGGGTRMLEFDLPRERAGRPGPTGGGEPVGINLRVAALDNGYVALEGSDVTEAHRLARVRRDFVANVSHELKTPVGALRLLAEALIEATGTAAADADPDAAADSVPGSAAPGSAAPGDAAPGDAASDGALPVTTGADLVAVRRFAERIRHESNRLSRLVGDLLELTRLQAADPMPDPAPVPVGSILAEVIDRSRTAAAAKGIEVDLAGEPAAMVHGNEAQLVTAVANLVENAVAYSAEGTKVTITTGVVGEVVEIAVADQGIGIEARDLDRIFERFYRADKARSRATGGTGLGLAIVKHIVTNHGGWVDVVSTPGAGSTFTLRLPEGRPATAGGRRETGEWPGYS